MARTDDIRWESEWWNDMLLDEAMWWYADLLLPSSPSTHVARAIKSKRFDGAARHTRMLKLAFVSPFAAAAHSLSIEFPKFVGLRYY